MLRLKTNGANIDDPTTNKKTPFKFNIRILNWPKKFVIYKNLLGKLIKTWIVIFCALTKFYILLHWATKLQEVVISTLNQ